MANYGAEAQPLLPNKLQVTPLPKAQLAVVLFARLAEPIAYTQIFPYINAMVEELGIAEPKRVGFYSGIIDSLFALVQLCTIVYWGGLSDRIGRKPVILIGLSGVSVATLCFGLSHTLWQLLLSRALIGALCGNVAVIYCGVSDITDETNQSKAFPLLSVIWYMGAVIGPFLGGMLSHPAERYPDLFGNIPLLRNRPFFLPCLVSVLITVTAILVVAFFMTETLPPQDKVNHMEQATCNGAPSPTDGVVQDTLVQPIPSVQNTLFSRLTDPVARYIALMGFCIQAVDVAFGTVFVLWSYTPLTLGGLQREPREIGAVLGVTGSLGIASSIVIFPYLHARFKSVPLLASCLATSGVIFAMIPFVGYVIRSALPSVGQQEMAPPLGKLWGFILCILLIHRFAAMSYP
ncbi:hypothetical protein FRC05_003910 [Tulasnella sp. 425]|nr:hypothetical protein FRC05_003910 [Tulasnella sp. 425]